MVWKQFGSVSGMKVDAMSGSLMDCASFENLKPIYVDLPGWSETTVVRGNWILPANARAYMIYRGNHRGPG